MSVPILSGLVFSPMKLVHAHGSLSVYPFLQANDALSKISKKIKAFQFGAFSDGVTVGSLLTVQAIGYLSGVPPAILY